MSAGAAEDWGPAGSAAVGALQRMVREDRVPHALLLSGPAGTGKRALALGLAQALNCEGEPRPCGDCRACARIRDGKHADVEVVSIGGLCRVPEHDHSASRTIGICVVRRLEMVAATKPFEGRQRIFVIDPADALSPEAADAFLKTLEEPPPAVTFALVSARPAHLSATLRSRCRTVDVAPLSLAACAAWLEREQGLAGVAAETLARMARGRIGWAQAALAEGEPLELRLAQTAEIRRLSAADRAERLAYAERLAGRGGDATNALTAVAHWIDWWRDLLLLAAGGAEHATHQTERDALLSAARHYRPAEIVRVLLALQDAERQLRQGVNPRLCLDALLLQLPPVRESQSPAGRES